MTKWIEGEALAEVIEGGQTFPSDWVKEFGGDLIKSLKQIHKRGIVHSDFDSSNIIVGSGGVPTIVDFGEAEMVDEGGRTGSDVVGLVLIMTEMLTGVQNAFEDGESSEERCSYLLSILDDDRIDEDLRGLCRDVCEKCITGCSASDFAGHEYFA